MEQVILTIFVIAVVGGLLRFLVQLASVLIGVILALLGLIGGIAGIGALLAGL